MLYNNTKTNPNPSPYHNLNPELKLTKKYDLVYFSLRPHLPMHTQPELPWTSDLHVSVMVYGHFGPRTLRTQDSSALVPKSPSDTSAPS